MRSGLRRQVGASRRRWRFIAASCVGVLFCAASPVRAAVFTVSNTADSGAGSLRAAVLAANANAGADRIVFTAGLTGTIALASTISITDEVTITGPGPRSVSVSGGNNLRIFSVTAPATITGLRLANGFTDRGAAIAYNAAGLLSVADCHFDQNTVTVDGGAIVMFQGSLSAERCTFTTDQAAGSGGVIWYGQGGGTPSVTITNCTFVNNFASTFGGAIRQFNTTAYTSAVTNCTFVVNNAGSGGGAIAVAGGTMSLLNDLFTANAAGGNPGGHVLESGGVTSLGHNLFGHLDGTTFTPAPSDRFGTVGAQLNTGVLIAFPFDNGGLTDTLPVNATSIAIDAGGTTGAPAGDQRDFPRVGCAPDIGAFEVQTLTDTDSDGVLNCLDACPGTPTCASVDQTGCPTDSDDDGVVDGCDTCSGTVPGDPVDANGCSTVDEDGDGVLNDADQCRGTQPCARASVDGTGCPTDTDGDGIFDGCDLCPGADDLVDTDGNGVPDCLVPPTTTSTTSTTLPELLAGKKLLLTDKAGKPQKRGVAVILGAPTLSGGNASEDDPVQHGGTLRVLSAPGGFDTAYDLPAGGWKYKGKPGQGKGYAFAGTDAITSVLVKPGKLARAIGQGAGLGHTLAANPDPVAVILELGTQAYCGRFGGKTQFTDGTRYFARGASAPAACGSPSGAFLD